MKVVQNRVTQRQEAMASQARVAQGQGSVRVDHARDGGADARRLKVTYEAEGRGHGEHRRGGGACSRMTERGQAGGEQGLLTVREKDWRLAVRGMEETHEG